MYTDYKVITRSTQYPPIVNEYKYPPAPPPFACEHNELAMTEENEPELLGAAVSPRFTFATV